MWNIFGNFETFLVLIIAHTDEVSLSRKLEDATQQCSLAKESCRSSFNP